ncbi:MAG TPA: hypothetical protein DIT64_09400 [Verrucomicrobiales bacterium]|nr:hypothetical protein [Verrucomicrobiales bacterium]
MKYSALFHTSLAAALLMPAFGDEPQRTPRDPSGGIFFYAKEGYDSNTAPVANPDVLGNWVQFYWSEIEKEKGRYDWSLIESRMKPWADAGKKVAFRVYWIGSGYWKNPAARTATPQSVWDDGAKFAKHADSGTEIPLPWDPIYQRRALAFLTALAERYDANPNVLFFDVTPGAETNPYRFVAFNQRTPEFKDQYAATPASDGRKYSDELWLATVRGWIDATDRIFKHLPLVVTLNVGTLNLGDARNDYSVEIGQYAVDHGFYVGQNGLHGASYIEDSGRKTAFLKWSKQTRIVFETLGDAGTSTQYGKKPLGSLREIVDAANRVNAHYLLPYPVDVLKGTKGQADYDPEFAAALAHGARTLGQGGKTTTQETSQVVPGNRARDSEPSWLMPPVKGPNLHYKTFDSKAAGQKVSYLIYLPPGYEASGQRRYPVVYWLHGIGGSQQGVPAMTARLTSAIEAGKTPPLIMVFVNGMIRSSYVDSADGKMPVETVSIQELIPHVDATYRTQATRAGRMIEGFSMGGGGAAKWGFKHPELFGSISIIDGALHKPDDPTAGRLASSFQTIYGGDRAYFEASNPWNLAQKNADKVKGRTPVRIVTSTKGLGPLNKEFSGLLTRLGIAHEFHAIPDAPHSPGPLYEGLGDANWAFYQRVFSMNSTTQYVVAPQTTLMAAKPASLATNASKGFQLDGERWTYRDGDFAMSGILLKPEGRGPFPAVLISHGLGGSAESFGMNKAREMVKWGFVCIAPSYTHTGGARGAAKGAPQPADYGASEENIRRAKTCLELASQIPEVDAKRLFAYGHSMGGFVTIGLAASSPGLLKAAAITGSGIAPRAGYPAPSTAAAQKIRTPFLILHGAADNVVRPEQSESLKKVLDQNKVPNDRLVADGQGHPIDQTMREEVFRLIREWFTQHDALKAK